MNRAQQQRVERLLKNVPRGTLWSDAIHAFIASKHSRADLSKLISDLKSQNHDCPAVMQNILGPVYQQIISL